MVVNKINLSMNKYLILFLFLLMPLGIVVADDNLADGVVVRDEIKPYKMPTFTGEEVDWQDIQPSIDKQYQINGDYLMRTVSNCYPAKPWGIEVGFKAGANYRDKVTSQIGTNDSGLYYAGIVFSMPLYSGSEINKITSEGYRRRQQTSKTIALLLKAVSKKRRANRMMGLYVSLEKRSQARVRNGIAKVEEQIGYLEKVAGEQSNIDQADADISGARIALKAQCRPDVAERVNNIILSQIRGDSNENQ